MEAIPLTKALGNGFGGRSPLSTQGKSKCTHITGRKINHRRIIMAKGTIAFMQEKVWTNPEGQAKKFYEVQIQGVDKKYGCWDHAIISAHKPGDEIEFTEIEKNGRWTMKLAGGKSGGFGGGGRGSNESFALSYAKDIVVALVNTNKIEGTVQIEAALDRLFTKCMSLIK
jgi:hypothetical protein